MGRIGTSRSWLGANASAALGSVLAAEGNVAEAEHELVSAERFFADEVATVHHTWLLVLLARVRLRRGRLTDAEATLRSAREALGELIDSGPLPALADKVEREFEAARDRASSGEMIEPPSEAELAVLRASGQRPVQPGDRRSACSSRRTRSGHTSGRSTTSSACTPARTQSPAPPRSDCWGKRNHPGERPAFLPLRVADGGMLRHMAGRNYRLIVEGELSDKLEPAFDGMTLTRTEGNTALTGTVRDQAELQGLLRRVSDLGLTLLEAKAIDDRPGERSRNEFANADPAGGGSPASRPHKKGADNGYRN